jgi:hypothetical protein
MNRLVGAALLLVTMLGWARAQEMVEVPTSPEVRQKILDAQPPPPPNVPPPSASEPLPPPIIVPPPPIVASAPLPPTEWRMRPQMDLVVLGAALFGGLYLTNLGIGLGLRQWQLDVPLVGPLLEIPRSLGGIGPMPAFFLVLDTAAQASGLAFVVIGCVKRRGHFVVVR